MAGDGKPRRWRRLAIYPLAVLLGAEVLFETSVPHMLNVRIESARLTGPPLRVLHISDVHGHVFPDGNRRLEQLLAEARPDLIAVTGDMLDHQTRELGPMYALAERLVATCPAVYYVSGNHEFWNPQREAFLEGLAARGVRLLNNRHVTHVHHGQALTICGVDDAYTGRARLEHALAGAEAGRFTLLLSHSPAPSRKLAGTPVDVMLAGHTHGGQVRLPLVGALWAPGEGMLPELDKGLYPLAAGKKLYIDSGLGTSILPIRFLNRSQLSLITIEGERTPP